MFERLKEKPDHIKKIISLTSTIVIFCGILFVWISSWDARTQGEVVREKTVSPISGITSIFGGFITELKDRISGIPSYIDTGTSAGTSSTGIQTSSSTSHFDLSGVVIIDSSASSSSPAPHR